MQIVKDIYLDFYQSEIVLVTAKQGDIGRFLKVTLLDNGNLFSVPAGSSATIARGEVWNYCTINDDGTILAPITADMRPGRVPAEITRYLDTLEFAEGQYIRKISHNRFEWEVELSNGLEIEFDTRFNVIGIDDLYARLRENIP